MQSVMIVYKRFAGERVIDRVTSTMRSDLAIDLAKALNELGVDVEVHEVKPLPITMK